MASEYLFIVDKKLEYPLDESIKVLSDADDSSYIVSNSPLCDTQIYAPEINFYIQNSTDKIVDKIKNIKALYDIRSLEFDLAKHMDFKEEVNDKLLIVTDDEKISSYKDMGTSNNPRYS